MGLRLADKWVWDFWLARDGADIHLFFLQADRALGEESLRHFNVSVGHAVSHDLRQWTLLPDALAPSGPPAEGAPEAWDSYTTWTGSVIQHAGTWYLFYTGSRLSEKGLIQRIGLATSADLMQWDKHPASPLIEADPQWYELLDLTAWHDQAWRDPYVFQHPETGQFHALITARANDGPPDGRGVIGHAVSDDLLAWEVQPPLTTPGEFGHLEVPQWAAIGGRYYLLFSVPGKHWSAARLARTGRARGLEGSHYYVSDAPLGPWRFLTDEFLVGDEQGALYSGKLAQDAAGDWHYLAFRNYAANGAFIGELADPLPVTVAPDGRLTVEGLPG